MFRMVVWGTGGNAERALRDIPSDLVTIVAFVDSAVTIPGVLFHGQEVVSPSHLSDLRFDILAIASCYYQEIEQAALVQGIDPKKICSASLFAFLKVSRELPFEDYLALSRIWW